MPPQEPVYHCHVAGNPRNPPICFKVTGVPEQTVSEGVPETEVGAVDGGLELNKIEAVTHEVVLHTPSALT